MSNNRVFRNGQNNDHLRSPYARNAAFRSPAASKTIQPKTPGSIFSKVKKMFSPGGWLTEQEDKTIDEDSDNSVLSDFNRPPPSTIRHQTPRNPIDEFHKIQNQRIEDSPNARLADFFARKGNEPLSEIELEGVKSLLAKSNSVPPSPNTSRVVDNDNSNDEDEGSKIQVQQHEILKSKKSESSIRSTPSFKATYNKSISEDNTFDNSLNSITSTRKRRVFDFSGFPSPYRTSRFKDSSFYLEDDGTKKPTVSSEATIEANSISSQPKEEKKLSNTASALLSFIEGNDDETTKRYEETQLKKDKKIDYSNPYASISSSHRRPKNKVSKFEQEFEKYKDELEQKKKKEQTGFNNKPAQPEIPQLKYKPSKSSSLRETVSLNDTTDQSVDDIDISGNNNEDSKDEIQVDSPAETKPTQQESNPEPSTETTTSASKFNSKPLFSFASKTSIPSFTPTEPKQQPNQTTQPTTAFTETKPQFGFNSSASTQFASKEPTEPTQQSLTPFSFSGPLLSKESRPPSSEFTFTFPHVPNSGYTLNDVDEEKVNYYKPYFKF